MAVVVARLDNIKLLNIVEKLTQKAAYFRIGVLTTIMLYVQDYRKTQWRMANSYRPVKGPLCFHLQGQEVRYF